jgi:hypothetical protein
MSSNFGGGSLVRFLSIGLAVFSVLGCGEENATATVTPTVSVQVRVTTSRPYSSDDLAIKFSPSISTQPTISGTVFNYGLIPVGTEVEVSLRNGSGGDPVGVDILSNNCFRASNVCFVTACVAVAKYVVKSEGCPNT